MRAIIPWEPDFKFAQTMSAIKVNSSVHAPNLLVMGNSKFIQIALLLFYEKRIIFYINLQKKTRT